MASLKDSSNLFNINEIVHLDTPRVAIVKTEWNEQLVKLQVAGATKIAAETQAIITQNITVPGCVEIPFGIRKLYESSKGKPNAPEAIIAFGAVIRGGTPHFDYVCQSVTEGVLQLNLSLDIPVVFGVLTLENEQQALDRLGGIHGHKGEEAMITALKMIQFNRMVNQQRL